MFPWIESEPKTSNNFKKNLTFVHLVSNLQAKWMVAHFLSIYNYSKSTISAHNNSQQQQVCLAMPVTNASSNPINALARWINEKTIPTHLHCYVCLCYLLYPVIWKSIEKYVLYVVLTVKSSVAMTEDIESFGHRWCFTKHFIGLTEALPYFSIPMFTSTTTDISIRSYFTNMT